MDFYYLSLLIIFSFTPTIFWLIFYYFYSPRSTTPKSFLTALFFLGILAAVGALAINQSILRALPRFVSDVFQKFLAGAPSYQFSDVLIIFILMVFLVAPVEELLKFFVIQSILKRKTKYLNQIIDGIKFGLVVGLGFAVVENAIYFSQPLAQGLTAAFLKLFFIRFFISTLAHSLYTGIVGYYIGLSYLYKMHQGYLLRRGIFIAIIMHGIFNFFLLANLGFLSIGVLVALLWLMIKWCQDRESLESFISAEKYDKISTPILSGKREFESFLFRHKVRYGVIKKLNLCAFCYRQKIPGEDKCVYCKMKQPI